MKFKRGLLSLIILSFTINTFARPYRWRNRHKREVVSLTKIGSRMIQGTYNCQSYRPEPWLATASAIYFDLALEKPLPNGEKRISFIIEEFDKTRCWQLHKYIPMDFRLGRKRVKVEVLFIKEVNFVQRWGDGWFNGKCFANTTWWYDISLPGEEIGEGKRSAESDDIVIKDIYEPVSIDKCKTDY